MDIAEHTTVDDFIAHHGVKGMKWGVIRNRSGAVNGGSGKENDKKKKARPEGVERKEGGGKKGLASSPAPDTPKPARIEAVKRSKASDLSNQELRAYLERADLEKRFNALTAEPPSKKQKAVKVVKEILAESGKTVAKKYATAYIDKGVSTLIKSAAKK